MNYNKAIWKGGGISWTIYYRKRNVDEVETYHTGFKDHVKKGGLQGEETCGPFHAMQKIQQTEDSTNQEEDLKMTSNFNFLELDFPVLSQLGKQRKPISIPIQTLVL